jgi:tricorn protease
MRTFLAALVLGSAAFALHAQPALFEPSLSPDAKTVAFVSGGDIWTAPAGGGEAHLLVAHPAYDSRPLFSPDGKSLAFISTRTGNGDIYVAELTTGQTRRLTYDDARDALDSWSRDGRWIYFSSNGRSGDTGANDVYRVAAGGGTPMMITDERMINQYHAAPSPDGKSLAFVGYGSASGQWWRHGRSHMDETQLWLLSDGKYRQLAGDGAKQIWPMWTPDGTRLFYMSDRDGSENIWTMSVAAADAKQVTRFQNGRVLWPSISYDGSAIVFERNLGIWRLDPASGNAGAIPIALRGIAAAPAIEHRSINDRFTEYALSPDGKKFAFVARGEVFAAPSKDSGDATRVTNTAGAEFHLTWSPDSKSVVYVSDRGGTPHIYRYDFATEKETQLTSGEGSDLIPRFSPDGKLLAFQRNHHDLDVIDLAANQTTTVATGRFDRRPFVSTRAYDFSPDSKWIAYIDNDPATLFANAFVVPVAGGPPRAVSFLSNVNGDSLVWSRDGKFLAMVTGQRTETARIVRIDLVPTTPKFREEQFRELFQTKPAEDKAAELKPAEKKTAPVEIELAGIRDRARLFPIGHDVGEVAVSPDGKWLAYIGDIGDDEQVYVYSIDELSNDPPAPKQLSSSAARKRSLQFTSDSKEVWYLDGGKVAAATIDPAKARTVGVTAELDVDFAREKEEAFAQAYTYLRDNFFDANMNGVNWTAERDRLAPYVGAALNGDEFRRLLLLIIGELNASHTGANPPGDTTRQTTGRLGLRFDRDEYESHGGALKVRDVIALSPADVAKVRKGEYVVAIDGKAVTPSTNFDSLLEYKSGKRTVVTVASSADGANKRDVIVQPIEGTAERRLTYGMWVNANRDYVHRISSGKLGYVHMYDMSFDSLQKLYLDLDAENRAHQGIVIDIRNNHGGFVNAYAIDVFSRRSYFTMTPRDFDTPSGARTVLGQRTLEKPTVLVINRHTLSDGEDFTEGYRALKLGKVVGEPTAGWIIFTSDIPLIDGTSLRLPSTRIRDTRGEDMEMHPRPVDRFVARPLGETYVGKDSQLDAAVEELLKDVK